MSRVYLKELDVFFPKHQKNEIRRKKFSKNIFSEENIQKIENFEKTKNRGVLLAKR